MSRVYVVTYSGTLTAAGTDCDLFYFAPAADKPIRMRGLWFGQHSDVGDLQEEDVRFEIIQLMTPNSPGSGGVAVTPVDTDLVANTTAGFVARCNDTTIASGTSPWNLERSAWNIRESPTEIRWNDEAEMPRIASPNVLVVRMPTAVLDDISIDIMSWIEELP